MKRSTKWAIAVALVLWAALFFGSTANAGSITLSCTAPTQNEDGTPLTDLDGIRFYEALVAGGPYTLVADEPVCATDLDRSAGTYYYVATAYNLAGIESAFSNEASKTILPPVPAPPENLVVELGNLVAYGLSQTPDVIRVYPIGTVPEGTVCDSTMRFNDKYRVPFDAVQWVGTARPIVVFAACGAV